MQLAILFWFYKEPSICENRLRILRHYNPTARIYGLFGGDPSKADIFQTHLDSFLDDFWTFTDERESTWKWYHGDQMIVRWYQERGRHLAWDSLFIAQWDMLVFGSLDRLFSTLHPDQLLLSGLRPLREVEAWWWYTRPGSRERETCYHFLDFVRERHGFTGDPLCCEFIVICLPRAFLDRYQYIPEPESGFLEYKIPVYAQIFGLNFCTDHSYHPWWGDDPASKHVSLLRRALNSEIHPVPIRSVVAHLLWPWGRRIFHPVFEPYLFNWGDRLQQVWWELIHEEVKPAWWRFHRKWFGEA